MQEKFGLDVARKLSRADEGDWPEYFDELRRAKMLSEAIRGINALLAEPEHRQVAISALKRVGLWDEHLRARD